jgi:hypothetical protein
MDTLVAVLQGLFQVIVLIGIVWIIILLTRLDSNHKHIIHQQNTVISSYEQWIMSLRKNTKPAHRHPYAVMRIPDRNAVADTSKEKD